MSGFVPHIKGTIELNADVTGISPAERIMVLADGRRYRYDNLISTMPLPELVKLIGDEAPAEVKQASLGLRHISVRRSCALTYSKGVRNAENRVRKFYTQRPDVLKKFQACCQVEVGPFDLLSDCGTTLARHRNGMVLATELEMMPGRSVGSQV